VRALVLRATAPIGQIARRDDQLRGHAAGQPGQGDFYLGVLTCTRVEIGDMQDVYAHGRMRL
jgi:hypothetical protein